VDLISRFGLPLKMLLICHPPHGAAKVGEEPKGLENKEETTLMSDCEDFAKRRFRIECSLIRFQRSGEEPLLVGPGHVNQTPEGEIEYLVHVDAGSISRLRMAMDLHRQKPAGALVNREEYYDVTMTPYTGEEWKGTALLPDYRTQLSVVSSPGVASGDMFEIRKECNFPGPVSTEVADFFLPGLLDFPTNTSTKISTQRNNREVTSKMSRDTAAFQIGTNHAEISTIGDYTVIKCALEAGSIKLNRHLRIRESLEFALAQTTTPCAMRQLSDSVETTILRSQGFSSRPPNKQRPPLLFYRHPYRDEVFSIAECFYKTVDNVTTERCHDASIAINALVSAASSELQAQSLVIPVAAETLARTCFPDIIPADPDLENEVKRYKNNLDPTTISPKLYAKLAISLDHYLDKNHRGNLIRAFTEKRGLDNSLYKAWNYLRNRHAHGEPIAEGNYEDTVERIRLTLYLCYTMVLAFIGYSGWRTNYTIPGFLDEEFRP
jgi:hypothetical protein